MPINVQCPRCGGMFAVADDMAGRQVTCQCGQPISVFAAGGAYQGGFQQPDPYRRGNQGGGAPFGSAAGESFNPYASPTLTGGAQWVMSGSPALRTVANGLGLVLIGLLLMILGVLSLFVLPFAMGLDGLWIVMAIVMGSSVCSLIGYMLCLAVPAETGAKPLIVVAVILNLVVIVLTIIDVVSGLESSLSLFNNLLALAAFICFVLFLKSLAKYIGRKALAEDANSVLVIGGIMMAISIANIALNLTFRAARGGGGGQAFACVLAITMLVMLIWFLIKYIGLLGGLRRALLRE